jgi:hypothetical protein
MPRWHAQRPFPDRHANKSWLTSQNRALVRSLRDPVGARIVKLHVAKSTLEGGDDHAVDLLS